MIESSMTQPTTTTLPPTSATSSGAAGMTATRVMNTTSTTKTESTSLMEVVSNPKASEVADSPKSVYDMIEGITGLVARAIELITTYLKAREKDESKPSTTQSPTTADKAPTATSTTTASQTSGTASPKKPESDCPCIHEGGSTTTNQVPTSTETEPEDSTTPKKLGRALSSSGEFLWKPKSDKDGKLAVLIPKSLTDKISEVAIVSPDKKRVLQRGQFSGVGNGERTHYRFSKPGGEFPDGAIVWIKLKDGSSRHVTIKNTAARYTK